MVHVIRGDGLVSAQRGMTSSSLEPAFASTTISMSEQEESMQVHEQCIDGKAIELSRLPSLLLPSLSTASLRAAFIWQPGRVERAFGGRDESPQWTCRRWSPQLTTLHSNSCTEHGQNTATSG